jgi:hypothetical protein
MILDRVTVTGADDSVEPKDLIPLGQRFPFVEWGILLSKSSEGQPRFPTVGWTERFFGMVEGFSDTPWKSVSGHLCGRWVRDLCAGNPAFWIERPTIATRFDRIQLNFHAIVHEINPDVFMSALPAGNAPGLGYIFQLDDVNNNLLDLVREAGVNAWPLFDTSGGAGVLPRSWPAPSAAYCGYAGGLSPENVEEHLNKIDDVCDPWQRIWIDVETRVRSADDRQFDLDKVARFLERASHWVGASR